MTESLAAALAELQTKLPEIRKSETAHVKSDKGSYSYSYADLAAISRALLPRMGELGLSFTSRPTLVGDRFVLSYALLHTSGEREAGEYPLPSGGSPQAIGSAITYARRYALCAVTGVAPDTDDDDGAKAQDAYERAPREEEGAGSPAAIELFAAIMDAKTAAELRAAWEGVRDARADQKLTEREAVQLNNHVKRRQGEVEP